MGHFTSTMICFRILNVLLYHISYSLLWLLRIKTIKIKSIKYLIRNAFVDETDEEWLFQCSNKINYIISVRPNFGWEWNNNESREKRSMCRTRFMTFALVYWVGNSKTTLTVSSYTPTPKQNIFLLLLFNSDVRFKSQSSWVWETKSAYSE